MAYGISVLIFAKTALITPRSGRREKDTTQPPIVMSEQNARALVKCIECNKPRVIYCNTKLDVRHKIMLSKNVREFEFTCGSHLFPPEEKHCTCTYYTSELVMCNASGVMHAKLDEKTFACIADLKMRSSIKIWKRSLRLYVPSVMNGWRQVKKSFTQRPYWKKDKWFYLLSYALVVFVFLIKTSNGKSFFSYLVLLVLLVLPHSISKCT